MNSKDQKKYDDLLQSKITKGILGIPKDEKDYYLNWIGGISTLLEGLKIRIKRPNTYLKENNYSSKVL